MPFCLELLLGYKNDGFSCNQFEKPCFKYEKVMFFPARTLIADSQKGTLCQRDIKEKIPNSH